VKGRNARQSLTAKRIAKSFSIRKFGRREALKNAIAARRDMLALVDNRPYLYDPIAKKVAAKGTNTRKRKMGLVIA
jgi:hypothetical protein